MFVQKFYYAKVKHLKECKPTVWWKEFKRLIGFSPTARSDPLLIFQHLLDNADERRKDSDFLASFINSAFLSPMSVFTPLRDVEHAEPTAALAHLPLPSPPRVVTKYSLFKKLQAINPCKALGPNGIPGWLVRENVDILAAPVAEILNYLYREHHLPISWKQADVTLVPKKLPATDVNKDLRPISLAPIRSKLAEDYVVKDFVKSGVLKKVDINQFGTIPNSCRTHALVAMLDSWCHNTDGTGSTVRVILFDFKKEFDLIDHWILCEKLQKFDLLGWTVDWIRDVLTDREQGVKLSQDCYSEWGQVPPGCFQL